MKTSSASSRTTYPTLPTMDRLADRFAFRRRDEVETYLAEHPELVPLLLEARAVIPRYFGPDAPVVLEVFTDPESALEYRDLIASIGTKLPPNEALAALRRFDDDWWLAAADADGHLIISLQFG